MSSNQRFPLATVELGGAFAAPHVLITAGVHGDEFEPMSACRKLIRTLSANELRGRVTIIPVVNGPAFERAVRCGPDGLDLARTMPGDPSGSITQQIAAELAGHIRAANYYIDLHTGGAALRMVPLAGYMLHHDSAVLDTHRRLAAAFGMPLVWGTTSLLEGRTLSVARDACVPAIYVEFGGGRGFDVAVVERLHDGCLRVLHLLDMIDLTPSAATPPPTIIEDDTLESGHLQRCHPAPTSGCFEPCVAAGQRVEAGQPLGMLTDILGEQTSTICAEATGLLICLRVGCRVVAGDGLAVIVSESLIQEKSDG